MTFLKDCQALEPRENQTLESQEIFDYLQSLNFSVTVSTGNTLAPLVSKSSLLNSFDRVFLSNKMVHLVAMVNGEIQQQQQQQQDYRNNSINQLMRSEAIIATETAKSVEKKEGNLPIDGFKYSLHFFFFLPQTWTKI